MNSPALGIPLSNERLEHIKSFIESEWFLSDMAWELVREIEYWRHIRGVNRYYAELERLNPPIECPACHEIAAYFYRGCAERLCRKCCHRWEGPELIQPSEPCPTVTIEIPSGVK